MPSLSPKNLALPRAGRYRYDVTDPRTEKKTVEWLDVAEPQDVNGELQQTQVREFQAYSIERLISIGKGPSMQVLRMQKLRHEGETGKPYPSCEFRTPYRELLIKPNADWVASAACSFGDTGVYSRYKLDGSLTSESRFLFEGSSYYAVNFRLKIQVTGGGFEGSTEREVVLIPELGLIAIDNKISTNNDGSSSERREVLTRVEGN